MRAGLFLSAVGGVSTAGLVLLALLLRAKAHPAELVTPQLLRGLKSALVVSNPAIVVAALRFIRTISASSAAIHKHILFSGICPFPPFPPCSPESVRRLDA